MSGRPRGRRELRSGREPIGSRVPPRALALLALGGAGVLWGASFLLGKLALRRAGPIDVILWRFIAASLALLALPEARRFRPRRGDLPVFVLAGVLNVPVTFLVQFEGLARTSASVAALIVGTLPALVALASRVFLQERVGRIGWVAVAASASGVGLIVGGSMTDSHLVGDALVFVSMFAVVGWVLIGKRLLRGAPPLGTTAWIVWIGTVALVPIALVLGGRPRVALPAATWGEIVLLGFASTACAMGLWNWGLRGVPAARAGVFLNLEPLVGASLGAAVLGDRLGASFVVGGVLVLAAAVVMSLQGAAPGA